MQRGVCFDIRVNTMDIRAICEHMEAKGPPVNISRLKNKNKNK
jgi:hypothetical protein